MEESKERQGEERITFGAGSIVNMRGRWYIELLEGRHPFQLTERQGKELSLIIRASQKLTKNQEFLSINPRNPKTWREKVLVAAHCHSFVARAMDFDIPLELLTKPGYSAGIDFAREEHYTEPTFEQFMKITSLVPDDPITVIQARGEGGRVTHTYLSISVGERRVVLEKAGDHGLFYGYEVTQDNFSELLRYGTRLAFFSFDKLRKSQHLKDYYNNPKHGQW